MTYRVFQWASGGVGRHAARAILADPGMELVGLHVIGDKKMGQSVSDILDADAGSLRATADVASIVESQADIVVHAPLPSKVYGEHAEQDLDDICALLAQGLDVVTVVGYLYPKAHGSAVVERINAACIEGGSTFHGTGLNPGWMGDLLPLTMSALSRSIEQIRVLEITNFQHYPSPEIMFGSMGFGAKPADYEARSARRTVWLDELFAESIQLVADGVGLRLDEVVSHCELALADEALETASGVVEPGTVAGQHWRWAGKVGDDDKIVHETVWRMHDAVAPEWPRGTHEVRIEGQPRVKMVLEGDYVNDGLQATAMHAVNAIPAICVAPPGIKTLLDLPAIMAHGAFDRG